MRIQAFLTAAAVNLKRLAVALIWLMGTRITVRLPTDLLAEFAKVGPRLFWVQISPSPSRLAPWRIFQRPPRPLHAQRYRP
jgi:hypothetical protein